MTATRQRRVSDAAVRTAQLVAAGVFLLPFVVVVLGSLRVQGLPPPRGVELLPSGATVAAYGDVLRLVPLRSLLTNSLLVTVVAVPLTLLVASLAGWGIASLDERRRRWALVAVVLVMLVPASAVWATRFEVFRLLGAPGLLPVIAPALMATSAFYVLIYVWAFRGLDPEVLDAAVLDGTGPWELWWRIGMPQVPAATLAVTALSFAWHWGNLLDPLLYLRSADLYTAPLGVRLLQQLAPTEWPLLLAAVTMITLPPVLVFLLAQRRFLSDSGLDGRP